MTDDITNQHSDQTVPDVFAVHRQLLHQALENSAASLRQGLIDQQKMYAQFNQGMPQNLQPDVSREAHPMEPITADFVGKAYRQAREMFEELKRKMIDAQSVSSPVTGSPEQDERTDQVIGDAQAATDLMMSQATSHLSAAMKAMVEAMDNRPTAPRIGMYEGAMRAQTRSS